MVRLQYILLWSAIAFEEKLAQAPKLTIGGKEVTLEFVDKETIVNDKRVYLDKIAT